MTLRAVRQKQRNTQRYQRLHLIRRDERGGLFLPASSKDILAPSARRANQKGLAA